MLDDTEILKNKNNLKLVGKPTVLKLTEKDLDITSDITETILNNLPLGEMAKSINAQVEEIQNLDKLYENSQIMMGISNNLKYLVDQIKIINKNQFIIETEITENQNIIQKQLDHLQINTSEITTGAQTGPTQG